MCDGNFVETDLGDFGEDILESTGRMMRRGRSNGLAYEGGCQSWCQIHTDNANSLTLGAHGVGGVVQACGLAIDSVIIPNKWLLQS